MEGTNRKEGDGIILDLYISIMQPVILAVKSQKVFKYINQSKLN